MTYNIKNKGAVILAAGYSSRMKAFKPLLDVNGKPALERVITALKKAGAAPVVVVTGHRREDLLPIIERSRVVEAFNPAYDEGMFSSVKAGIRKMQELCGNAANFAKCGNDANFSGMVLMPADYPAVSGKTIKQFFSLINGFDDVFFDMNPDENQWFAVACYKGKKGHPLWIPAIHMEKILEYEGNDGLKGALKPYEENLLRIETESESVVLDMDTPEAYEDLLEYMNRGRKEEDLHELAAGRRFFLVRHGQIQRHTDKIFLGQYDVKLSEYGKEQAGGAARELRAILPETGRIYSSDLLRAAQTAEIIAEALQIKEIKLMPELREISLGAWDGQLIGDIKERYPEEYEKRGRNLLTYKFDSKSESFYDMQYRVQKAIKKILKEDPCKDLIFVTHAGVIRAGCLALDGIRLSADSMDVKVAEGSLTVR